MLDRFERPIKIVCLAMAFLLAWQLGGLILGRDPLAKLKIPALPKLPGATNEPAKLAQKETNAANATIGTNAANGTNATNATKLAKGTNTTTGTNVITGTNAANGTNALAKSTNAPAAGETAQTNASAGPKVGGSQNAGPPEGMPRLPPGMTPQMMAGMPPEMMAQMMGGGMPGGPMGGGMKKIALPHEVQARVDRIIDSEIFGPIPRPMPMALIGIAEQEAYIQATNGQTGPVKVGGELGGIKLLRIGINRVLVESGGETNELTLFGGLGGESLMPKSTNAPSTNMAATNAPSTNGPAKRASTRNATAKNASSIPTLSSKEKETP
jgi:hypothetical protein